MKYASEEISHARIKVTMLKLTVKKEREDKKTHYTARSLEKKWRTISKNADAEFVEKQFLAWNGNRVDNRKMAYLLCCRTRLIIAISSEINSLYLNQKEVSARLQ